MLGGCEGDSGGGSTAAEPAAAWGDDYLSPVIIDCHHVRYQGYTYAIEGCHDVPYAAFTTKLTDETGNSTNTASFVIECVDSCIIRAETVVWFERPGLSPEYQ